jgi:hypothetical protein
MLQWEKFHGGTNVRWDLCRWDKCRWDKCQWDKSRATKFAVYLVVKYTITSEWQVIIPVNCFFSPPFELENISKSAGLLAREKKNSNRKQRRRVMPNFNCSLHTYLLSNTFRWYDITFKRPFWKQGGKRLTNELNDLKLFIKY